MRAAVIRSTRHLGHLLLTRPLLEELRTTRPDMLDGIWQEERPLAFDSTGHLDISWPGA